MAKKLKYVGLSDHRVINKKDFTDNGVEDQGKVEWTRESVEEVSDAAGEFLAQFSEFKDVTDLDDKEARQIKTSVADDQTINHTPDEEEAGDINIPDDANVVSGSATGGRSVAGGGTSGTPGGATNGGGTTTGNGSSTAGNGS